MSWKKDSHSTSERQPPAWNAAKEPVERGHEERRSPRVAPMLLNAAAIDHPREELEKEIQRLKLQAGQYKAEADLLRERLPEGRVDNLADSRLVSRGELSSERGAVESLAGIEDLDQVWHISKPHLLASSAAAKAEEALSPADVPRAQFGSSPGKGAEIAPQSLSYLSQAVLELESALLGPEGLRGTLQAESKLVFPDGRSGPFGTSHGDNIEKDNQVVNESGRPISSQQQPDEPILSAPHPAQDSVIPLDDDAMLRSRGSVQGDKKMASDEQKNKLDCSSNVSDVPPSREEASLVSLKMTAGKGGDESFSAPPSHHDSDDDSEALAAIPTRLSNDHPSRAPSGSSELDSPRSDDDMASSVDVNEDLASLSELISENKFVKATIGTPVPISSEGRFGDSGGIR